MPKTKKEDVQKTKNSGTRPPWLTDDDDDDDEDKSTKKAKVEDEDEEEEDEDDVEEEEEEDTEDEEEEEEEDEDEDEDEDDGPSYTKPGKKDASPKKGEVPKKTGIASKQTPQQTTSTRKTPELSPEDEDVIHRAALKLAEAIKILLLE